MILVPKKIKVGYQKRGDTYTEKLAYVIYYDDKGKLRKETSWESWRDQEIPFDDFENEPISGFVLNRKAGGKGYSSWDTRKTYCRVFDPRGFEMEIDITNLLYILENTNSIVGKGLEGEFVYGWDGTELVLIPTGSHDYTQIIKTNAILFNKDYLKAKDLEVGKVYENLDGRKYLYMGKHVEYAKQYSQNDVLIGSPKQFVFFHIEDDVDEDCYGDINKEHIGRGIESGWLYDITTFKTLPKLISSGDEYHPSYPDAVVLMEKHPIFHPGPNKVTYHLRKSTVEDLENYDTNTFRVGRNHHYMLTEEVGMTTRNGTKMYFFIGDKNYHSYRRTDDGKTFEPEEFINEHWLKTLVKNI